MAPFPEEIDVFSEPHSRMKRLVEVYSEKLWSTDFLNDEALESFLHSLQQTFFEFKTHEQIENRFIMRKLKNKLKALSIHDATVCNCHNDSKLVDMLALVRDGYCCTRKPYVERRNYALKLQNALNEFTQDFIPHMREEEEVFQPLLMKYFEYDELKLLKERVLLEHNKWQKEHLLSSEDTGEKETSDFNVQHDKKNKSDEELSGPFHLLPPELVTHIFSFLSPIDLVKCSEVSSSWHHMAYDNSLWKHLNPCQWANGNWEWRGDPGPADVSPPSCMCTEKNVGVFLDEDADQDDLSDFQTDSDSSTCGAGCVQQRKALETKMLTGITQNLLNKVGPGVLNVYLSQSIGLTSRMLLSVLKQCPNLQYLDVSYTSITDSAFKRLQDFKACHHLEHLDLSGCSEITDIGLKRFAACFRVQPPKNETVCLQSVGPWRVHPWDRSNSYLGSSYNCFGCPLYSMNSIENILEEQQTIRPKLKVLSLSGCFQVTDFGIRYLSSSHLLSSVEHFDVSGCWQLTGPCLEELVHCAPKLHPEGLYYCNYIEDGPFQDQANGCENLECSFRACCCKGD